MSLEIERPRCAAAALVGDGLYKQCETPSNGWRAMGFDGWAVTVWLCDAHHELWAREGSFLEGDT